MSRRGNIGRVGPDGIGISVPAREMFVEVCRVEAGETLSFAASRRWTDWFVNCGPDGYRNFLADVFAVSPRRADSPYFSLVGCLDKDERRTFEIGRGCTKTFDVEAELSVFANDHSRMYRNNRGSVCLTVGSGGVAVPPAATEGGIPGSWHRLCDLYARTLGAPLGFALAVGSCCILAFTDQGRDLLRTTAEGSHSNDWSAWRQLGAFGATLLFLAIQTWFWSRTVINSNFTTNRDNWKPRWILEWAPRLFGVAPFALVVIALFLAPEPDINGVIAAVVALGVVFFAFVVFRQDALRRWRSRRAGPDPRSTAPSARDVGTEAPPGPSVTEAATESDEPPWPFGRWWAILGFAAVVVLFALATLDPVSFGTALGPAAVVFLGVGLMIPVVVTVVQLGASFRLPVTTAVVLGAFLFSLWLDNHGVGQRGLHDAGSLPLASRIRLDQAYSDWRRAQPNGGSGPLHMVLVASEGGASRAGYWTGTVLSALHERTGGLIYSHLFAVNSVSGGSVGAVGYLTAVKEMPGIKPGKLRALLHDFTGSDALSPLLAGMLFPDLVQRFVPVSVFPDRAAALESAWETAWDRSCESQRLACSGRMRSPFLTLGPAAGGQAAGPFAWTPIPIVQGASEDTGRRVLTTPLDFSLKELDADDFYSFTMGDVRASTAIHNGARFPWISPAGTLRNEHGATGHIVDGGYFDPAGVEVVRELAAAIAAGPGKDDDISFTFVFIGYRGATDAAQAPEDGDKQARVLDKGQSGEAGPMATAPGKMAGAAAPPDVRAPLFANEVLAPVRGLLGSRDAHGAHLMRNLRQMSAPDDAILDAFQASTKARFEYVPVIVCDRLDRGQRVSLPLDWALSDAAKDHMTTSATSASADACGCGKTGGAICARDAIQRIADAIADRR